MLKKILILILITGFQMSCSSKKKGMPLFLLMLGGGTGGSTDSVPASTSTIENATDGSAFTVVPTDASTSDTGTTTPPPPSSNTTSGNGNDTFTPDSSGNAGSTQVSSNIRFQVVNDTFQWDNTISTNITIRVSNEDGAIPGITVKVSEDQSTAGLVQFLSQGVTGANGEVTIRITVRPNVSEVIVTVFGINPKTGQPQEITGRIPIQVPASTVADGGSNTGNGGGSNGGGTVVVSPDIDLTTGNFGGSNGCVTSIDSDCDGVLDADDDYPTDPTLGWIVRSGRNTLAWEDYYKVSYIQNGTRNPNNDMDLNDHVTVFSTETDYTPAGKVKTIRGIFTHVGKGAGFNHDLRLSLDVPTTANVSISYTSRDGNPIGNMNCSLALASAANAGDCVGGNLTSAQLKNGILIFPNSSNTLYGNKNAPNVGGTLNFVLGMTANFTITFAEAVDLNAGKNLSGGHLNYFLAVSGTGEKIFRPGFYHSSGENSYDLYIDRITGFPFGVIVPGVFNYPREVTNIMDPNNEGKTGYPAFKEWASSKGSVSRNWFEQIMTENQKAYIVDLKTNYTTKPYTAVLIDSVHKFAWQIASGLVLIGFAFGLYFRRKLLQSLALI
ncbi:LruC domain-containing protein [Leptospira ognonensis]|uniref:LruC domain-containing protein n=1 Tax=Leptospira ognonensis TaxID=2484945 RepID=A0A4R9KAV8_9LEPT|nr:LruC domain-containing protein [Leptospira ognonensis]TGL61933.1 LruC domain-containing protein [Leptospira ognonensis]